MSHFQQENIHVLLKILDSINSRIEYEQFWIIYEEMQHTSPIWIFVHDPFYLDTLCNNKAELYVHYSGVQ